MDVLDERVDYGETTKSTDTSVFYIEVVYPDTRTEKMRSVGWNHDADYRRYAHSAFNDRRRPSTKMYFSSVVGTFDKENSDVADAPSRVTFGGAASDRMMAFTDPVDALLYADRLRKYGELASKQAQRGQEFIEAHERAAKEGLKVRVVHERVASFCKVVKGLK